MKKTLLYILGLSSLLLLAGCLSDGYEYKYDKGYENAWEDEPEPPFWASQDEKDGYEDGEDDAEMYDEGYYDGTNDKKPAYLDDECYMEGYDLGKSER